MHANGPGTAPSRRAYPLYIQQFTWNVTGRQPALELHRFAHLGARQRMERGERSLLPAIPRPEAGKLANVVGLSNRGRSRFSRSLQRRSIEAGPNPLKSPLLRE